MPNSMLLCASALLMPMLSFAAEDGPDKLAPADRTRMERASAEADARLRQERIRDYIQRLEHARGADLHYALMGVVDVGMEPSQAAALLAPYLVHEDPWVVQLAADALGKIGPAATETLPSLLRIMDEASRPAYLRAAAIEAASSIAPGNPDLLQRSAAVLSSNRHWDEVVAACHALERAGAKSSFASSAVRARLDHANLSVSYAAWRAMGAIRATPSPTWSELAPRGVMPFLGEDGVAAFTTVSQPSTPAAEACARLVEVLRAPAALAVHLHALTLLAERDPSGPAVVEVLVTARTSRETLITQAADVGFTRLHVADAATVAALATALRHDHTAVAEAAAQALSRSGTLAVHAVPALEQVLNGADGRVSMRLLEDCLTALRAAGPAAATTTTAVRAFLDPSARVHAGRDAPAMDALRAYALLTLVDIGIDISVLPTIRELLASERAGYYAHAIAARAAGTLGVDASGLAAEIAALLTVDGGNATVVDLTRPSHIYLVMDEATTTAWLEAIRALVAVGPAAKPYVPLLRERAADAPISGPEYPHHQAEAARAAELLSR